MNSIIRKGEFRMSLLKLKEAAVPAIAGGLAIMIMLVIGDASSLTLLMAPFGATCVLAFALPDSPQAQPRSIIGGHLISTLIGMVILQTAGAHTWSLAAAVGVSIYLMKLTRTVHPPAGADPLVVLLSGASWSFLITPVLIGTLLITVTAWLYRTVLARRLPKPIFAKKEKVRSLS